MAYPTIVRNSTVGGASSTSFTPTMPTHTDAGADGLLIVIASNRINGSINTSTSGWFKLGEIIRTSGAIGCTAIFGKYVSGSAVAGPLLATSAATLWYVTTLVLSGVSTIPSTQQFSLGTAASAVAQTTTSITTANPEALVFGVFADSRTTTLSGTPQSPAVEYVDIFNATYDNWHYVAYKQVATSALTNITVTPSTTASMKEATFEISGIATNLAPTISIQPSFATGRTYAFGSLTAIPDVGAGAGNGGTISFRATDAEQTGANALSYELRSSATPGAGTLMASGTCTSGVTVNVPITNSTTGFTSNGDKTVYVHVSDGTSTTVSNLLTVRVDESSPAAASSISTDPVTVNDYERYRVVFTPNDTTSPAANELRWEIRTGSNGTGTQLASGNGTNATPITTAYFNDTALTLGSNTRYIRVQDAGGNITQTTFTVTRTQLTAWDQIEPTAASGDDGYYMVTGGTTISSNTTTLITGWLSTTVKYASWSRFQLDAPAGVQFDHVMMRAAVFGVYDPDCTIRITAHKALNPTSPALASQAISAPRTTAYVDWVTTGAEWDVDGAPVQTPDLSPIFEELVAQPGWTPGNYVVLFFESTDVTYPGALSQKRWDSFDNTDTTPRLYVDWVNSFTADETAGIQIVTTPQSGTETYVWNETAGSEVIASIETGTDYQTWVWQDTAGTQVVNVVQSGTDNQTWVYNETSGTQVVLTPITGTDSLVYVFNETGGVQVVLAQITGTDNIGINENAGISVVLTVITGTDDMPETWDETTGTQIVLAVLSGNDYLGWDDVDGLSIVKAVISGTDTENVSEAAGAVVVRVKVSGTDWDVYNALEGISVALVGITGTEHHIIPDLGGISVVQVVLSGTDEQFIDERAGIELVHAILTGNDYVVVDEVAGEYVITAIITGTDKYIITYDETTGIEVVRVILRGTELVPLRARQHYNTFIQLIQNYMATIGVRDNPYHTYIAYVEPYSATVEMAPEKYTTFTELATPYDTTIEVTQ